MEWAGVVGCSWCWPLCPSGRWSRLRWWRSSGTRSDTTPHPRSGDQDASRPGPAVRARRDRRGRISRPQGRAALCALTRPFPRAKCTTQGDLSMSMISRRTMLLPDRRWHADHWRAGAGAARRRQHLSADVRAAGGRGPPAVGQRTVTALLSAAPATLDLGGPRVRTWAYGDSVPGPLLRATAGDRLRGRRQRVAGHHERALARRSCATTWTASRDDPGAHRRQQPVHL